MNQDNNSAKVFLTVNTFTDQNDGNESNGLSLRDAILIAQRDQGKEYVITLPEGTYNLTIQGNEDFAFQEEGNSNFGLFDRFVARTGDLDIETRVTIIGESVANTFIDASVLGDRIFDVRTNGFLTLDNVTVQNGRVTGTFPEETNTPPDPDSFFGGGIRINLGGGGEINNSVIQGNRTVSDGLSGEVSGLRGGGIANLGQLEINDSTIIDNISDLNAGGIYNTGTLEIFDSSIINNSANTTNFFVVGAVEGGGGIQNTEDGTLLIKNSTIAGNETINSGDAGVIFPEGAGGGGILSDGGQVTIINSTIVDNSAPIGAGILINEPSLGGTVAPAILQNSIVAQNTNVVGASNLISADIEGLFDLNSSFNFIGNANGVLFDGVENNIVGDSFNPIDPRLTPLQFNGGLTPTYEPLADSPVINAGSNAVASQRTIDVAPLVNDQTGKPRIIDDIVDIGSVEFSSGQGINSENTNSGLNNPVYRFQNNELPGTYLYTTEEERTDVLTNFPQFAEEGFAFNVGLAPDDDLIALYRFQNTELPGTYLYAGEEERSNILNSNFNFVEEGLAFYVLPADANVGQDIYRLQNQEISGTYLYVNSQERQDILNNSNNFVDEGVAFEV